MITETVEQKVARLFNTFTAALKKEVNEALAKARAQQAGGNQVDLDALFGKILGTVDTISEQTTPLPAAGRFNVSVTLNTVGSEGFLVIAENTNCEAEQVDRLRSLFHLMSAAAAEAPSSGPLAGAIVPTTLQFGVTNDKGETAVDKAEIASLAQKATLDVALGDGISAIGREQLKQISIAASQTPAPETQEPATPAPAAEA